MEEGDSKSCSGSGNSSINNSAGAGYYFEQPVGIINPSQACALHVVLTTLHNIDPVKDAVLREEEQSVEEDGKNDDSLPFFSAFRDIFSKLSSDGSDNDDDNDNSLEPISATALHEALDIDIDDDFGDAVEYYRILLAKLMPRGSTSSIAKEISAALTLEVTQTLTCIASPELMKTKASKTTLLAIRVCENLDVSLAQHFADEKLEYKWNGVLSQTSRSLIISTPPKFLVIVLKRFDIDPYTGAKVKVNSPCAFDEALKLQDVSYELNGVIVHEGSSATEGHYYCAVKKQRKQKGIDGNAPSPSQAAVVAAAASEWFIVNDEKVTSLKSSFDTNLFIVSAFILVFKLAAVEV
jgi:uncharacterized UBP type Zn finger protein